MSHFIYTDLISSLVDSRLVDLRSTLIHVGTYVPKGRMYQRGSKLIQDQRVLDKANYYFDQYK